MRGREGFCVVCLSHVEKIQRSDWFVFVMLGKCPMPRSDWFFLSFEAF